MQAVLFDIDGVLLFKGAALPGAAQTLSWVQQQGIPYRFLTNTTSKPVSRIAADLQAAGIAADEAHILTPPIAARQWLQQQHKQRLHVLLPQTVYGEFGMFDLHSHHDPEALVIGDMGTGFTFEVLNQAFRVLMDHPELPLLALGMTRYFAAADGLQLDVGPFVKALEYATGREALVMGKPAASFFQQALVALNVAAEHTLMIGDDRIGDVLGAQACGIHGALVRTGKYRPGDEDADRTGLQPQYLLDSVAGLPELWHSLQPSSR
ncbi:MAG: TIGR01458 family HAD-type hydrolase [Saccharospirillaceae bacterium]|nr:TIGR01458 family HAD-type hydrolase [Saccharospirillaceae bacterium]MCD8530595.1 TIGR01458 family HAD-type hydrolase [Saccharospirillaceae bacterium]